MSTNGGWEEWGSPDSNLLMSAAQGLPVRHLGRTGIAVTELGLGGAPLGGRLGIVPSARASAVLETFFELGLNLIDTAARYREGRAERELGRLLAHRARPSIVISTKVSAPSRALRRSKVLQQKVLQSLERLECGWLDIVLIHDPESADELAEDLLTLTGMKNSGVLRAVGVGVDDVKMLTDAVNSGLADCVLISGRYTLLDQSAGDELLPLCGERDVGVLLGSVLHSGILATGHSAGARFNYSSEIPEWVRARMAVLEMACTQFRVPLSCAAVRFGLEHRAVSSVLVGTTSSDHLARLASAPLQTIPEAFWRAVGLETPSNWSCGDREP